MLKALKEFLHGTSETTAPVNHSLEMAAAVLMMEISLADSVLQSEERQLMEQSMQKHFHLTAEETESILSLARKEVDHAVSLYDFTQKLKNSLSMEERIQIIEILWRIAFADSVVDKYEEYFVRKIADLLYLSHSDYIKAKHRAST